MDDETTARAALWVVATPLGNPADMSERARQVLGRAGMVLCEDTRRAARLFSAQGLALGRFLSLYDHNEAGRVPQVLDFLAAGGEAALISDAGTPVLSDPGYLLVRACREAGFRVSPVPGPCAAAAALMACGLAAQPFAFLGFLPRKAGDIRKTLERFAQAACTLVFFERKDRLAESLAVALETLGPRECVIAREITKVHEEFLSGRLEDFAGRELGLLGEITVVLGPALAVPPADPNEAERILRQELAAGGKPRDMARRAASRLAGLGVKEAYERLTAMRGETDGPGGGRP